ncbi:PIN domain-containing protein [Desulfonatronum thioautotrophicum]|uniref:PIN domain-containing protein n=1 Tax=Desulfonatronum thioautotrophicum TaxID=617001 RepID=UPI0005EAEC1D|nr:PIN domain-containing protein [Desulfonatronum thioautotrophicum]
MVSSEGVFLDVNILFSIGYGSKGLYQLIKLGAMGQCCLLASRYVIEEAKRNLTQPDHLAVLQEILKHVRIVPEADPGLSCPIDLPPKDKPVFMAAATANADFFLTGDARHFGAYFGQSVFGVTILMARDYLARIEK